MKPNGIFCVHCNKFIVDPKVSCYVRCPENDGGCGAGYKFDAKTGQYKNTSAPKSGEPLKQPG